MKVTVHAPCSVLGATGPENKYPTWVNILLTAQVSLPALPIVGDTLFFSGTIHSGKVARVQWFWTEEKNVLKPLIGLRRLWIKPSMGLAIEKAVMSFKREITEGERGMVEWTIQTPTVDLEFETEPKTSY